MKIYSTIKELMAGSEAMYGNNDYIRYKAGRDTIVAKTFTDIKHDSECFSRALNSLGIVGEHIALAGATSYAWMVAYFGIVNSASVAVTLGISLPADDFCELVNHSDAVALVIDGTRLDIVDAVRVQCPKVRYIISTQREESEDDELSFAQLLEENEGSYDVDIRPDMLSTIMYTSGTTGKSKGVMLSHRNLAENATFYDPEIKSGTVILSVLPIHHAYCLNSDFLRGLYHGVVICINDSLHRVAKNMKLFQPEMVSMVPIMIEAFAKKLESLSQLPPDVVRKEVFGERLHVIWSGGAYMNPQYYDLFGKYGIRLFEGYGMTECAPVISTCASFLSKKGAVGYLIPNVEVKVVNEELWVSGNNVMMGYYKMPDETREALEDGWLKTGDLGYVDEDGFVYLTGRKKNLIITKNGENVSPEEIENKLGEARIVQEVLIREKEGIIEAEIFPDYEYVEKEQITDVRAKLQQIVDQYNKEVQCFKRVYSLIVRETEFPKNATRKIVRY